MTPNDFRIVAEVLGNKCIWSDEELLQSLNVHYCLLAYFRGRKEPIIAFAIQMELNTLESYANARKWKDNYGTWQIRKNDGTLA